MSGSSIIDTNQYLTFKLNQEIFALEINKVREVLEYTRITEVPQTPEFMLGVINLRGSVVPVVDMRLKFGMVGTETTVNTCIVIVETELDGEITVLGALVDSVQEVMEMDPEHIEPPPRLGTRMNSRFIKGMGKREEAFIIILDLDKVFSLEDMAMVQEMTGEMAALAVGG